MRRDGFSLIEVLITLLILGIVLAISTNLISQNQRVMGRQILVHQANDDVRLAHVRIGEVVAQAAYIYPLGSVIQLPTGVVSGNQITTSRTVLALLMPTRTPYCGRASTDPTDSYCGFIYRVDDRSNHTAALGTSARAGSQVLTEQRFQYTAWPADSVPIHDWAATVVQPAAVVMDSVDGGNLTFDALVLAGSNGVLDKELIASGSNGQPVALTDPDVLISGVRPQVAVLYTNGVSARRTEVAVARGIPRVAPPGTGN